MIANKQRWTFLIVLIGSHVLATDNLPGRPAFLADTSSTPAASSRLLRPTGQEQHRHRSTRHRPRRTPAATHTTKEEPLPPATPPSPPLPPSLPESPVVWLSTCFAACWAVPSRHNPRRATGSAAGVGPGCSRGRWREPGSRRGRCRNGCGGPPRCSKRRLAERTAATSGGCWRRTALSRRRSVGRGRGGARQGGRQGGSSRTSRRARVCVSSSSRVERGRQEEGGSLRKHGGVVMHPLRRTPVLLSQFFFFCVLECSVARRSFPSAARFEMLPRTRAAKNQP